MRPLKSHFPVHALATLDTMLKQTKEARVFRRAQAVRAVVAGHHISTVSATFHLANSALRKWVQRFAQEGPQGLRDRARSGRPPKITCALEPHLHRLVDEDPLEHGSLSSQWGCRELATSLRSRDWGPAWPRECPRCFKKQAVSFYRPTGLLTPDPAALAYASVELATLEYQARRGELILLYADETILWRFALPRAGWWHRHAQRYRLPTRPLTQRQIKREEALKRDARRRYRSWSRITSGVLLSIIGAVQYGTAKVFYKIVPQFDAEGFRHYIHQMMAIFAPTGKEVVMVVDRSGIHRAHTLASTLAHWQGRFRLQFLPARCGHHLNPIEGFWRVLNDRIGAGRCFPDLQQLYWRVRRVFMAHQEQPIYAFRW